jgi:beta-1,4-mannosyl-glycoprotein beta-1,4-N-acetylglucosaminyltransferase
MIYDCFTFFNELELLELRLNELADVVDKFVLVEATKTHSNKTKPLYYQENRARFGAFHDKIIHIVVDDLPTAKNPWVLENFQRNAIARGLANCQPKDVVMVSDLDEIPRASMVAEASTKMPWADNGLANLAHAALKSSAVKWLTYPKDIRWKLRKNHPFIFKFQQVRYDYFLNCRSLDSTFWYGTRMLHYRDFSSAEEIRHSGYKIVENGGWHFTYMGGAERISQKLQAYAHQENNQPKFTDPKFIHESINRGQLLFDQDRQLQFVPLDDSFPRYILENREKYAAWIKPV